MKNGPTLHEYGCNMFMQDLPCEGDWLLPHGRTKFPWPICMHQTQLYHAISHSLQQPKIARGLLQFCRDPRSPKQGFLMIGFLFLCVYSARSAPLVDRNTTTTKWYLVKVNISQIYTLDQQGYMWIALSA